MAHQGRRERRPHHHRDFRPGTPPTTPSLNRRQGWRVGGFGEDNPQSMPRSGGTTMELLLGRVAALAAAMTASTALAEPTLLHISSHLAKAAKASLDGGKPVVAPGEGSTTIGVGAGVHVLSVTTAAGHSYRTTLELKP